MKRMKKREVFTARDAQLEIERVDRPPSTTFWSPLNGFNFKLIIPTTVYPPREDTDLMARRIIALGPGRGRKILEIGCGSGRYLIELAVNNTKDSFIGIELRYKRLVLAAKKIERQNINNILLMRERGEYFDEYFQQNSLDFLHINFPDPWIKKSQRKNRLLKHDFLAKLTSIMRFNGEFRFKTDHLEYFETVSKIFSEIKDFTIIEYTKNLHRSIYNEKNILTEFEMLFKSKGNPPIGYLLAKKINNKKN